MDTKYRALCIILSIGIFFIPGIIQCQNKIISNNLDSSSVFLQDAKHFANVGFGLLTAPFMFDGQDWALVGLTTGGTVLLFSVDKGVKHFALRNQTRLNDNIFNLDSYHGNYYSLFMASGIYGYGSLAGNSKIRKIGLHAIEAYLYSSAITGTIKLLLGRRRPYSGESQLFFKPYQPTNSKYRSLPSGHTTVSFAVSTVIAKSVDNVFWKTFWYGSAGLVAISRIYHNRHWLSDVFLGSTIGYAVGDYVVNYDNKKKQHIFGHRIKTHFALGSIGVSIYLN